MSCLLWLVGSVRSASHLEPCEDVDCCPWEKDIGRYQCTFLLFKIPTTTFWVPLAWLLGLTQMLYFPFFCLCVSFGQMVFTRVRALEGLKKGREAAAAPGCIAGCKPCITASPAACQSSTWLSQVRQRGAGDGLEMGCWKVGSAQVGTGTVTCTGTGNP